MEFPKEIIEEFSIRLPVKSLMRFKCVSKEWNDFIIDSNFRRFYMSRQQSKHNAPTGIIWHTRCSRYGSFKMKRFWGTNTTNKFVYASENYVELDCIEMNCYVLAISKGLFLLRTNTENLYVYDLVSNKSVSLPRTLEEQDATTLGFECEEKNGKLCYKVVSVDTTRIHFKENFYYYNIEIYTSENQTWKKAILKVAEKFDLYQSFIAKVIGGVFHWRDDYQDRILAYDSEKERTSLIILPASNELGAISETLEEFERTKDGSLQFIDIGISMLNVWILSKQNYVDEDVIVVASRWNLVHNVRLSDIFGGGCSGIWQIPPHLLGVDRAKTHVIYFKIATRIYAYNYHDEVVASSQQLMSPGEAFIQFEWPTWPCL